MLLNKIKVVKYFIILFALIITPFLKPHGQSTGVDIRPSIKKIVTELSGEKTLHLGAPVGFAGTPETHNKYFKLYQKLGRKATDKELVSLTEDDSKVLVLYSFLILHSRNYSNLKEVFLKNIKDNSDVRMASDCTGIILRVNMFMLQQLNPAFNNSRQQYLTKEEYDKYLKDLERTK